MKFNRNTCLLVLLGLGVIGWGLWVILSSDKSGQDDRTDGRSLMSVATRSDRARSDRISTREKRRQRKGVRISKSERSVPQLDIVDERELSKLQLEILEQLRSALNANDLKGVRRAVARFNASTAKGGLEGMVPKVMRSQAVQALGWFGSPAIADLTQFMADADPDVEEDAFAQFEMSIQDWDLGDRMRADILKQVLRAMTDTDRIDMLLMNLDTMRNSVKADVLIDALTAGSEATKAVVREEAGFYTDTNVEPTAEGIKSWSEDNPDLYSDEEAYGPAKK